MSFENPTDPLRDPAYLEACARGRAMSTPEEREASLRLAEAQYERQLEEEHDAWVAARIGRPGWEWLGKAVSK